VGASAANPGPSRRVVAIKTKKAVPINQRELFFTFPSLLGSVE